MSSTEPKEKVVNSYRFLILASALIYLVWWKMVELTLPGSFNPLPSRLAVVGVCLLVFLGSVFVDRIRRNAQGWFRACAVLVTLHYFYLFQGNHADINWVVGSYITVIAVCVCLPSPPALLAYGVFVMALSVALAVSSPLLLKTVFLPGMGTLLAFAYFGNHSRAQLIARENAERRRSEENRIRYETAQEALKLREEFISIASHELKTPLTSIKIQTGMAARSLSSGDRAVFEPERVRRFVAQTDRNADRLIALVEEMLDVSKISSGNLELNPVLLDLRVAAEESFQSFRETLRGPQAESALLKLSCGNEPVPVLGDLLRLEQVVTNLLVNAMKYGRGKPVSLEVDALDGSARLIVRDHGIGIAKEDQERIFQKFERAVSVHNVSGLGLGLYICKKIVEAHGGKISVDSRLDEGACFTVALPLQSKGPA